MPPEVRAGERAGLARGGGPVPVALAEPERHGPDLERRRSLDPAGALSPAREGRPGPTPEIDEEESPPDQLQVGMPTTDLPVIQAEVGVGSSPDQEERLAEGPSLAPLGPTGGEVEDQRAGRAACGQEVVHFFGLV